MDDLKFKIGQRCALSLIELFTLIQDNDGFDLSKLTIDELDLLRLRVDSIILKLEEVEIKENEN